MWRRCAGALVMVCGLAVSGCSDIPVVTRRLLQIGVRLRSRPCAAPAPAANQAAAAPAKSDNQSGADSVARPARTPVVLFFGTSLTAGYGLDDPATQVAGRGPGEAPREL